MIGNIGDTDQMPRSVASDLGMYFLSMSHKRTLDLYGLIIKCNFRYLTAVLFSMYGPAHEILVLFLKKNACAASKKGWMYKY